jgi:hypothetical protein
MTKKKKVSDAVELQPLRRRDNRCDNEICRTFRCRLYASGYCRIPGFNKNAYAFFIQRDTIQSGDAYADDNMVMELI